jgi:hypothetical protein
MRDPILVCRVETQVQSLEIIRRHRAVVAVDLAAVVVELILEKMRAMEKMLAVVHQMLTKQKF